MYELPVACWPFLLTTIYKQCDVKTCCLSIKHQTLTCTIITCACSVYIRLLVKTQKKRFDSLKKVQSLASEFWHLLQPIEKRTINNFLRGCVISLSVNSMQGSLDVLDYLIWCWWRCLDCCWHPPMWDDDGDDRDDSDASAPTRHQLLWSVRSDHHWSKTTRRPAIKTDKISPGWDCLRVTKDPLDPQVKSTNSSLKRLRVSCKNPAEL